MEWLILLALLALPVLRFVLLPARAVGQIRRLPLGTLALVGAALVGGWIVLQMLNAPDERTGRYMRGDAQLRNLID